MSEFEIVYALRYHMQDMPGGEKLLTKGQIQSTKEFNSITEEYKKTLYLYDDGNWYWHPILWRLS